MKEYQLFKDNLKAWLLNSIHYGVLNYERSFGVYLGKSQTTEGIKSIYKTGTGEWSRHYLLNSHNFYEIRKALGQKNAPNATMLIANPVVFIILNELIEQGLVEGVSRYNSMFLDECLEVLDDLNNFTSFTNDSERPETFTLNLFILIDLYRDLINFAKLLAFNLKRDEKIKLEEWQAFFIAQMPKIEEFMLNRLEMMDDALAYRFKSFNFIHGTETVK